MFVFLLKIWPGFLFSKKDFNVHPNVEINKTIVPSAKNLNHLSSLIDPSIIFAEYCKQTTAKAAHTISIMKVLFEISLGSHWLLLRLCQGQFETKRAQPGPTLPVKFLQTN